MPPRYAGEFGEKTYGKIFRYDNGDINVADDTIGYFTDCVLNDENQVVQLSESRWMPFECYSTITMYNCGPFAPCLFRPGDASDDQDPLADAFQAFRMMHFLNQGQGGVSRASTNGNVRMVAGRDPTWVGSLVPEAYNNKRTHTQSLGLGGEFGLLIGLMALAQHRGQCDEAFTDPQWAGNRWTGRKPPPGWPRDTDSPRGVVVEIAIEKRLTDARGPPGSTLAEIYNFEWHGTAVREL
ncbi:hypothetical protein PG984_003059 [Apiospora sp. TS-2023a]